MKTVILCGGSGTRLWPVSRKTAPKQFAKILDDQSLFEKTIERNENLSEEIIVIVNEKQFSICESQTKSKTRFLLEPIGRNTAPAIALACFEVDPEDILLIVPSDHLIGDSKSYHDCVTMAQNLASSDYLVTFGINAKYPETGYGYIEASGNNVVSFKEKPDFETAKQYVNSGNYYWNSGMFCFKAKVFLEELAIHSPEIYKQVKTVFDHKIKNNNIIKYDLELMLQVPDNSIDYAVMEKSNKVKVVPSNFMWSDLGSFDSLYEELSKDENQNATNSTTILINSKNNLILGNKRVITTFDVNDLIIVDTADALLIGKRGQSQNVKKIVDVLKVKASNLLN